MGLIESFIKTFFLQKAVKEVAKTFGDTTDSPIGRSEYRSNRKHRRVGEIRSAYFAWDEVSGTLLTELFRKEPDLIDGEITDDCREFLNIFPSKHLHNGVMCYDKTCFTFSARNRFFAEGHYNSLMLENMRDCEYVDFSMQPINPIVEPLTRSISLAGYTLFFDQPFFYNLMLMLLKDSEQKFQNGERLSDRANTFPMIVLDEEILREYDVNIDENAVRGIKLRDAYYAVLNDFNVEQHGIGNRRHGDLEVRVIDTRTHKSDDAQPCPISDLLWRSGFKWISIIPGEIAYGTYLCGVQFNFLDSAEGVIIRGNKERREIYVCRTIAGWGGIKFSVRNLHDYYNLAAWLVVAVSTYCSREHGWDREELIHRYWPSYNCN